MGWFSDRYGEDAHPIMSIDTYKSGRQGTAYFPINFPMCSVPKN